MKNPDLKTHIPPDERIIWQGKPDKKCLILESIFNPMLFFALIWGGFDITFMVVAFKGMQPDPSKDVPNPGFGTFLPILIFFGFHMMPVWLYLGGIIRTVMKNKAINYVVTDKGVYVLHLGVKEYVQRHAYTELEYISVNRGVFDKMLKVGDIHFNAYRPEYYSSNRRGRNSYLYIFHDIRDFSYVQNLSTKLMQEAKNLVADNERENEQNVRRQGPGYGNTGNNYGQHSFGQGAGYGNTGNNYGQPSYGQGAGYGNTGNNYGQPSYVQGTGYGNTGNNYSQPSYGQGAGFGNTVNNYGQPSYGQGAGFGNTVNNYGQSSYGQGTGYGNNGSGHFSPYSHGTDFEQGDNTFGQGFVDNNEFE